MNCTACDRSARKAFSSLNRDTIDEKKTSPSSLKVWCNPMGNYSIVLQVETWLIFVERPVYLIKLEIGSLAQSIESP